MKVAAILVLIVAVVSGAWAINDYRINEEVRRDDARLGITYLSFRNNAGETVELDMRKIPTYYERHDAIVGAFSAVSLIGSAVLFSRRKRRVA